MKQIQFEVPGKIVPKGRPRFARRGKFISTYTPQRTKSYEQLIAWTAKAAGVRPAEGSVSLTVTAFFKLPDSISKKERDRRLSIGHTQKPDCDNIVKIMDGLNGIAYYDDAQVTEMSCSKQWTEQEEKLVVLIHSK